MLYTKLPTSAIDFDDSVNGGVYGKYGPCPLISGNGYSTSDLYMTPYSTIFSHWPAVVVIGCVGVVLFLLTVTSLFSSLLWTDDILIMHGPGVAGDIALLFGNNIQSDQLLTVTNE